MVVVSHSAPSSPGAPESSATLRALAARFGLTEYEVQDILTTPLATLKDRDRFCPPSNTETPTNFPRLPLGSALIDCCITDPHNAYVSVLRRFDPWSLTPTEAENGIRRHPTFARYVQWWRDGLEAPPVYVFQSERGDGKLYTSCRRRTLTSREAGVPQILGWYGPHNAETNLPLKYGDVLRAAAEAGGALAA